MIVPDPNKGIEEQEPKTLLSMLVWGEARGEVPLGQVAVAHVPLTRLGRENERRARKAKSLIHLRDIILAPFQFSCFNAGDPNRVKLLHPVEYGGLGLWALCWRTAAEAFDGQSVNPAKGATHYVVRRLWSRPAVDARHPKWFERPNILSGRTRFVEEIGGHVFAQVD